MSQSLSNLKNVSARDRKMIQDAEAMLGPEPSEMGFVKNLFWGRFRDDLVFPYPRESKEERAKCDALLAELEDYLKNEHPSVLIDQEQYIPEWSLKRLFDLGVMGMTVPEAYDGLGLGVTSYNRALELIGRYCASTAVVVSAHQSIGCKAIMLFGTEEQKKKFLPKVAREYLSAFCLSEPNVGSDAAGQETHCELTEDGEYYILNGEKKWSTSGAMSGVFTVMTKQRLTDPKTGKEKDGVTALICTPDMEGVDIFEKNRSKTGIRGTWQARVRFTDVKVPKENRLHKEGKGLTVALTCLNYGRCTLSAGVTGAAKQAMDQSIKWVQTRYQFGRPLADFELVQQRIARMAAYTYALDASLYMMTGMLDRHDEDIMVETAITKILCSGFGWEVIDDAMQIMGGEGYMTENEFERLWRDNRIHRIVEGSNEVMQSFIFAYGGKQLAQQMIGIQEALLWDRDQSTEENVSRLLGNLSNVSLMKRALPLGAQLFLGILPGAPLVTGIHPALQGYTDRLSKLIQKHSHFFKMTSKWEKEQIVTRQAQHARIADNAVMLFALTSSLSKMDMQLRDGEHGVAFERDRAALDHLFDLFELAILKNFGEMRTNADDSMRHAAEAARRHNDTLPNSDFYIHEGSPVAKGLGHPVSKEHIKQFPGDRYIEAGGGDGAALGNGHAEVKAKPATKKAGAKK
ncbi:MAG: acyl-CoA dehydrogenase family protein [Rhodothermales bacterium]